MVSSTLASGKRSTSSKKTSSRKSNNNIIYCIYNEIGKKFDLVYYNK